MPSQPPSTFEDAEHSGAGIHSVAPFATHRFDSPHIIASERSIPVDPTLQSEQSASALRSGSGDDIKEGYVADTRFAVGAGKSKAAHVAPESTAQAELDPHAIREAHADDLIGFLQQWSEDLDQRSARLHADIATQERRERAFRLWMQNRRAEWEQKITECEQMQRHAEAVARRIAFSG